MGGILARHGEGDGGAGPVSAEWVFLLAYLGGFAAFVMAAVALVRRSERRLGPGPDTFRTRAPASDDADPVSIYLDRMSAALRLPAGDVAEVRAELADHLADSIASLQAEGLDTDRAIREALARLGSADELALQLRAAHQSTRRLLAGVGGGVFAGAGGFVLGYLGGFCLLLPVALVLTAVAAFLTVAGVPLPDLTGGDHTGATATSLMTAFVSATAAGTATRYAVRTSAGLSSHAPRAVAGFWAVALGIAFGALAIFGIRGPQSWPGVAAEMLIPVVAVAAALVRIDRPMPHVGRWAVVCVGVAVLGSVLMLGVASVVTVSGSGPGLPALEATRFDPSVLHFDTVGPAAPAIWLPEGSLSGGGWSESDTSGTSLGASFVTAGGVPPTAALANWHDIRFEAWHMTAFDQSGPPAVDTHYSSPFALQPATVSGVYLTATFHFERMRGAGYWDVFLTGVGPDGVRHLLEDCGGGESVFNGSAWDWMTAAQ